MAKDKFAKKMKLNGEVLVDSNNRMVICTDNAMVEDGKVSTDIQGRTFGISGTNVLRIQALLAEKKITTVHGEGFFGGITYVIVGENAEYKEAVEQNIELNKRIEELEKRIEEFNKSRHWWERKLKV